MNATLNLTDSLLAMGRELHEQGRKRDARLLFVRLLKFRDLPTATSEEAHARLAELLLAERQYKAARRHLAILMCMKPSVGRYFYLFAVATCRDPKADPHRSIKYFKQALNHDPSRPRWWAGFGRVLLRVGKTREALKHLEQAHQLAPDDPVIIRRLVEGLCLDERADEARLLLQAARFRHPRDARFLKLWNDFQFERAAAAQCRIVSDEPILLPFVRRAEIISSGDESGTILRIDDARINPAAPHRSSRAIKRDA